MSENNARDAQFQGFAKLLVSELLEADLPILYKQSLIEAWEKIVARRAYDLVTHAFEGMNPIALQWDLSSEEITQTIPDMTTWPQESSIISNLHINHHEEKPEPEPAQSVAPQSLPGLTPGRNVHYVAYNNTHLAAMIIGHDASQSYAKADLAVFTSLLNVNGVKNFGLQFHPDVSYSDAKEPGPGTWHWIEQA